MKKTIRSKLGALLVTAAVPGMFAFSCSGSVSRQFRDAAINGATTFVEAFTLDLLSTLVPTQAIEP